MRRGTRRPYEAGPRRRAVVVDDLAELTGPTTGVVELPLRLFWQSDRRFGLDDPGQLRWLCRTVLREAVRRGELRAWLAGLTPVRLSPELYLPPGVRQAWQERFSQLVAPRAAGRTPAVRPP